MQTAMPAKQVPQPPFTSSNSSGGSLHHSSSQSVSLQVADSTIIHSSATAQHDVAVMLTSPCTASASLLSTGQARLVERRTMSHMGALHDPQDAPYDSDDDSGGSPPSSSRPSSAAVGLLPLHGMPSGMTQQQRVAFSLGELLGLFAVSFSYAFCFNSLNTIVIPKEIERLTYSRQSMWVGLVMATGAVSQLSTPIVGAWSDRAGTRTPYLIYGTFIAIIGVILFVLTESFNEILFLFAAHITTTIGLSVQYSMVTALLNDYVSEEHTGKGSGAMAILAIFGSGAGYIMFALNIPLTYSYCSYIFASVVCLGITVIFIPQQSLQASSNVALQQMGPANHANTNTNEAGNINKESANGTPLVMLPPTQLNVTPDVTLTTGAGSIAAGAIAAAGVLTSAVVQAIEFEAPQQQHANATSSNSITSSSSMPPARSTALQSMSSKRHQHSTVALMGCKILVFLDALLAPLSMPSPTKYPDFFFACCGRALFNAGLSGQVYLVYYLRDIIGAANPVQITSMVAVMALLGGVVGALPSGMISDKVGKKPVIYGSTSICVVTLMCFMIVRDVTLLHVVGFLYGVGNVAYLSVDYALGVQALPKKRGIPLDAAKDLGVFAMSATVGALFGQVIYGAILDQFSSLSRTGHTQYHVAGFLVIYALGGLCFVFSGVATSLVRNVR